MSAQRIQRTAGGEKIDTGKKKTLAGRQGVLTWTRRNWKCGQSWALIDHQNAGIQSATQCGRASCGTPYFACTVGNLMWTALQTGVMPDSQDGMDWAVKRRMPLPSHGTETPYIG